MCMKTRHWGEIMRGMILFAILLLFLVIGRSILIPLLVAIFLWYLVNAIASYIRRVMPWRTNDTRINAPIGARIMDWASVVLAAAILVGFGYLFATQVRPMYAELMAAMPTLQQKLGDAAHYLSNMLGVRFDADMIPNITRIATNIGGALAGIATSIGMILIYMVFMFLEQRTFNKKFNAMFPNKLRAKKIRYIIDSIDSNMKRYLFIKTLISAVTAIASYVWLSAIGLEFAGIWAFLVFVANYIPTIGAIVACGLPIVFALITAPTLHQPILTAVGMIGIQIIFGNIIEPKLTGHTLNLSTLAILINLVFWGMIWGIAGMFFSVPLLVAVFVITAQFDSTRPIAVLLSADGKIPDKNED